MPNGTPQQKKKGFGEKLKGVGKAIGRGLKKVPGIAYRDVAKPYGEHLLGKFTERPDISPLAGPIDRLPIGMGRKPKRKARISDLAGPIQDLPIGMGRKAAPKPQPRRAGRGKTTAYDMPGKSAVERLAETAPKKKPPTLKGPTKKEPLTASEGRVTKPTDLTAKASRGDVVTVIGEMPPAAKKPTPRAKRGKTRRKFSPKKTAETLREAGKARREQMAAVPPPDTTAAEMARMITEQEIAREAQRTEAELKGGRKPQREKARYRYRTRGLRRTEGRGR